MVMKEYVVTLRRKNTGALIKEVTVTENPKKVEKSSGILCLSALRKLRSDGFNLPNQRNMNWSYREKLRQCKDCKNLDCMNNCIELLESAPEISKITNPNALINCILFINK